MRCPGVVVALGAGVTEFQPGRPGHGLPPHSLRQCYYCQHKMFSQCETYKKVGCTAGFEPRGGGFAEYIRVMDWIVEKGSDRAFRIPSVSSRPASSNR